MPFQPESLNEAIEANRIGTERRYAYGFISLASGGSTFPTFRVNYLHSLIWSGASLRFKVYDNASGASGTTILNMVTPTAGASSIIIDAKVLNGITFEIIADGGNAGAGITFTYR